MRAHWRAASCWIAGIILLAAAAAAQPGRPAPPAEGSAIRDIISRQVAAFRRDDAESAFALASPRVRTQFGIAANFIVMVREGYAAVYRPREFVFGGLTVEGDEGVQEVHLTGPDGAPVTAVYLMQRQPDGAWRIDGCVLLPSAQTRT
jgi:ketosteroid isomerase-like protein